MSYRVAVHIAEMRKPDDVSELAQILDRNGVDDVVAIVGKTEGTGLGHDEARETADQAIKALLAGRLQLSPHLVSQRICCLLSGGSPGVITPHVAVFYRHLDPGPIAPAQDRLVVGLAHSDAIAAEEIGRLGQISKVAAAVRRAQSNAGITDPTKVHAVLVKAPSLTAASLADADGRGVTTVTRDLGIGVRGAQCFANDASALGVAIALGEVGADSIDDDTVRNDYTQYSSVAMTSSGGEKTHAEVFLLGNGAAGGHLRIGHSPMQTILDIGAVGRAIAAASGGAAKRPDVTYALAKMIVPGSNILNGHRITLLDDPQAHHTAKAMGGYLLAATTGSTCVFMSGGEQNSHQGPPGGNPLAVIVDLRQPQ